MIYLKGEEYGKLRGYNVSFSVDSSYQNKIAFKFTVNGEGIFVGEDRVREDFNDYINKIKDKDRIDDLPIVISKEEHEILLTTLKNRINFLSHNYNLEKNANNFYQKLLSKSGEIPFFPQQNIVLQTGGAIESQHYNATSSSNVIQGNQNQLYDHSNNKQINIGNTFSERKNLIDALNDIYFKLYDEKKNEENDIEPNTINEIQKYIKQSLVELQDEEEPDPKRIKKWLEKSKDLIQAASFGKEFVDSAKALFGLFGLNL